MTLVPTPYGHLHARRFGDCAAHAPLVFLHALGTDHRIWADVVDALPRGLGGVLLDLPGHGLSEPPRPGFDVQQAGDQLLSVLSALDLDNVVLVGLSVGGQVALAAARQAPSRIAGMVLCNTGAVIGASEQWQERIEQVERSGLAAIAEGVVDLWVHEGEPHLHRSLRAMLMGTSVDGYLALARLLMGADLHDHLPRISAPTLCLASTEDRATPPAMLRELAGALPNARVELLPGTGHVPTAQAPELLAKHIACHVAELDPREPFSRGMAVRRAVLGDPHVDRANEQKSAVDEAFQRFITEGAWGSVWARPQLSRRERSMVTVALLSALNHLEEVEMHAHAARNTGARAEDFVEVLLHVAVYAGVPAANSAIRRVKAAFEECGGTDEPAA
ncbi:MAG: 4-carboxymuconolactone decarboxylase [Myxococcales bacterium]|nr:4-carboxymuconolactone decarboxylase [Myxococcales bacterium]